MQLIKLILSIIVLFSPILSSSAQSNKPDSKQTPSVSNQLKTLVAQYEFLRNNDELYFLLMYTAAFQKDLEATINLIPPPVIFPSVKAVGKQLQISGLQTSIEVLKVKPLTLKYKDRMFTYDENKKISEAYKQIQSFLENNSTIVSLFINNVHADFGATAMTITLLAAAGFCLDGMAGFPILGSLSNWIKKPGIFLPTHITGCEQGTKQINLTFSDKQNNSFVCSNKFSEVSGKSNFISCNYKGKTFHFVDFEQMDKNQKSASASSAEIVSPSHKLDGTVVEHTHNNDWGDYYWEKIWKKCQTKEGKDNLEAVIEKSRSALNEFWLSSKNLTTKGTEIKTDIIK